MPKENALLAFLAPKLFYLNNPAATSSLTKRRTTGSEEFRLPGGQPNNNVTSIVQKILNFWFGSHKVFTAMTGILSLLMARNLRAIRWTTPTTWSFSYVENLYWGLFGKLWVCTYGGGLFV